MKELRLDIQALRGIAVLLVVAYHAGLPGLSAGYLGVDLFFVISGFLITGIIARGMDHGSFSFREFYYRRARRLLPAAYVVLAAVVAAAPFVLSDAELAALNAQVIGALAFVANWVLWQQTGYFEGAADLKPLLHFWSLAVEEQYYFVMPLLLLAAPRRMWITSVAVTVLLSFSLSVYLAPRYPDFAFYLPFTRMWELGLGSLGALIIAHAGRFAWLSAARVPAIAALVVIPFSPSEHPHPGVDALIVCAATLIIILGRNGNALERSWMVRVLSKVGDISYSLYLVHWPVLVLTRSAYLGSAPVEAIFIAVALSVVLSWALHRYVEEPFRSGAIIKPQTMVAGLSICSATLLVAPSAIASRTDSAEDFSHIRRHNYGIARQCAVGPKFPFTGSVPDACRTKPDAKVLVWGDSYAMAWNGGLKEALKDVGVEQATKSACDPLLGMARFSTAAGQPYNEAFASECIDFNDQVLAYAKRNNQIKVVVLAGRLQTVLSPSNEILARHTEGDLRHVLPSEELAASGMMRLAAELAEAGKKVVVLAPPPADGSEIGDCLERVAKGKITLGRRSGCDVAVEDVQRHQASVSRMLGMVGHGSSAEILNASNYLCNGEFCKTSIRGTFLYRDYGHLSVDGSAIVAKESGIADRIGALAGS